MAGNIAHRDMAIQDSNEKSQPTATANKSKSKIAVFCDNDVPEPPAVTKPAAKGKMSVFVDESDEPEPVKAKGKGRIAVFVDEEQDAAAFTPYRDEEVCRAHSNIMADILMHICRRLPHHQRPLFRLCWAGHEAARVSGWASRVSVPERV